MRLLRHIITVIFLTALLLGIPVILSGYPKRQLLGVDTISSATTIIEAPSGEYVVLINKGMHRDEEKLLLWETFFSGGEIDYIFEDISALVPSSDTAGLEIAKSFQSRLPENQMSLRTDDTTLVLSKAYYGRFDIVILSKEFFLKNGGEDTLLKDNTDIVYGG